MGSYENWKPPYGARAEAKTSVRISTINYRNGRRSARARYFPIVERGGLERGGSQLADPAERLAGLHFPSASLERPPKLVVGRRLVGVQRHGSLEQYYGLFRLLQPEFGFAQIEVGRPGVGL